MRTLYHQVEGRHQATSPVHTLKRANPTTRQSVRPWCGSMVIVPKKFGNIRICVDLKLLNESVMRETHPISKVDDTLAQLSGVALFSKLDTNSDFWQNPLSKASRPLSHLSQSINSSDISLIVQVSRQIQTRLMLSQGWKHLSQCLT